MSFNSLKKTIKYRVSYSGTKETDILYKRYFINQLDKFSEKDLEDINRYLINSPIMRFMILLLQR